MVINKASSSGCWGLTLKELKVISSTFWQLQNNIRALDKGANTVAKDKRFFWCKLHVEILKKWLELRIKMALVQYF